MKLKSMVALLFLLLLLGSCASKANVDIVYMKPAKSPEKALSNEILVLPAIYQEGMDPAQVPDMKKALLEATSATSWEKLTLKAELENYATSAVSQINANPFIHAELLDVKAGTAQLTNDKLVLAIRIPHMYSRVFDESYVNSGNKQVGSYRAYYEGDFQILIFDGNSGSLLLQVMVSKKNSDTASTYEEARDMHALQGAKVLKESTEKALQEIAPYLVYEKRALLFPDVDTELFKNARTLIKKKDYLQAIDLLMAYYQSEKILEAGFDLAIMYEALGRFQDAIPILEELVARSFAPAQNEIVFINSLDSKLQDKVVRQ